MDQHQGSAENSINDSIDILHTDIVNQNGYHVVMHPVGVIQMMDVKHFAADLSALRHYARIIKPVAVFVVFALDALEYTHYSLKGSVWNEIVVLIQTTQPKYLRLIFASKELLFLSNVQGY